MMHQRTPNPRGGPSAVNAAARVQLGEALIIKGLITREQLDEALENQAQKGHRKLLGELLVELNFVTEEQVMEVLADGYGIPFVTHTAKIKAGFCGDEFLAACVKTWRAMAPLNRWLANLE